MDVAGYVISAVLYFSGSSGLEPIPCERVTIEWGQVACYDRLRAAGVSVIHPSYVERVELVGGARAKRPCHGGTR